MRFPHMGDSGKLELNRRDCHERVTMSNFGKTDDIATTGRSWQTGTKLMSFPQTGNSSKLELKR
jgi:hypothetical protein